MQPAYNALSAASRLARHKGLGTIYLRREYRYALMRLTGEEGETMAEPNEVVVTISREKTYPSRPRPGAAWNWNYRVVAPAVSDVGSSVTTGGYEGMFDRLDSARDFAKHRLHATTIVETWRTGATR